MVTYDEVRTGQIREHEKDHLKTFPCISFHIFKFLNHVYVYYLFKFLNKGQVKL